MPPGILPSSCPSSLFSQLPQESKYPRLSSSNQPYLPSSPTPRQSHMPPSARWPQPHVGAYLQPSYCIRILLLSVRMTSPRWGLFLPLCLLPLGPEVGRGPAWFLLSLCPHSLRAPAPVPVSRAATTTCDFKSHVGDVRAPWPLSPLTSSLPGLLCSTGPQPHSPWADSDFNCTKLPSWQASLTPPASLPAHSNTATLPSLQLQWHLQPLQAEPARSTHFPPALTPSCSLCPSLSWDSLILHPSPSLPHSEGLRAALPPLYCPGKLQPQSNPPLPLTVAHLDS